MKSFAEAVKGLTGCFLCRQPIAVVGCAIPIDDATYAAFLKLRETPLPEGEDCTPTFNYGLCRHHAQDWKRSTERVQARLLAAAAEVAVH